MPHLSGFEFRLPDKNIKNMLYEQFGFKDFIVVVWFMCMMLILYLDLFSYLNIVTSEDFFQLFNRHLNVLRIHILITFPLTIYFLIKGTDRIIEMTTNKNAKI